ncbi:MAG: DUF120 domain-containing protein, partial [Candidatus Woesearchaeota archaeon]|nr:DUF120 domain-containing protein [Candidatus Woesearchaeota archaeon]
MKHFEITGTVFSGLGEAGNYMNMPEYKERFRKYLGFSTYLGTLNLKIAKDDLQKISSLEAILIPGFSVGSRNFDSIKC